MIRHHVCKSTTSLDILNKYIFLPISYDPDEDIFIRNNTWHQYYLIIDLSKEDAVYLKLTEQYLFLVPERQFSIYIREYVNDRILLS